MPTHFNSRKKGDRKNTGKTISATRETSGFRIPSKRANSEVYLTESTWLGHDINEHEIKQNRGKVKTILQAKLPNSSKEVNSFLGAIQNIAKNLLKLSGKIDRMRELVKRKMEWKSTKREREDFNEIKNVLTEHHAQHILLGN